MPRSQSSPSRQNAFLALAWMSGALLSFSMVAIAGRGAAGAGAETMEIMAYRSIVALVILVAIMPATRRGYRQIATHRFGLHALRNGLHFIAQYAWFGALTLIPLAQLFSLEFTAPLWVAIMAPIFLSERLSVSRIAAALIGFAGVMVIVRPGSVPLNQGTIFALIAALGFASSMIATRSLMRSDTVPGFLFHMSWMQALLAFAILYGRGGLHGPEPDALIWFALVGAAGLAAHFSLACAFRHAEAIVVAPMDFLRLPLIAVVGLVLYQEQLDPFILLGGGVVVLANLLNIWTEHRRSALRRPAAG